MKLFGVPTSRVLIDSQTGIVSDDCITAQRADERYSLIGSTLTGTGYATAQRALRKLPLAKEFPELKPMIGDVTKTLTDYLRSGKKILVEGHQGAGLSNYHGDYPYTSNRDSTAAELLSELGIGIRYPIRIVLAIKAFPTRNHNGRLPNEMTTVEADTLGVQEYGGGSWGVENDHRRVARIDLEDVRRAVYLNTPTDIALTGIDYLDVQARGATDYDQLSDKAKRFIGDIENAVNVPVTFISTAPETSAMVYRKTK
jgi:adenylosuccinate synthase